MDVSSLKDIRKKSDKVSMQSMISFWKREKAESILIEFGAESDATLEAVQTTGKVSEDISPLYENIPKMLEDFEKSIKYLNSSKEMLLADDGVRIPIAWPELQFGNGMGGAIFGGKVKNISTVDHTYTFNEPVIKDWSQIEDLEFDMNNYWVLKILECLRFFRDNAKEEFLIRPFFIYEGADFLVSMRGTTQAFYDLADRPEELFKLYEIGRKAGINFFEMKREIIKEHNEKILCNKEYSDMAPLHSVPMLDMDAYALCSPDVFKKIGFENKQKILDHFGGGSFYIHALGRGIIPIAADLENLTELWLFDDPKCPRYFDSRMSWRKTTHDIPLQLYCGIKEFLKALDDRSLPGGIKYNIFTEGSNLSIEEKSSIIDKVKKYRTSKYKAKPK